MGDGRGPAPERAQLDALLRWREENARQGAARRRRWARRGTMASLAVIVVALVAWVAAAARDTRERVTEQGHAPAESVAAALPEPARPSAPPDDPTPAKPLPAEPQIAPRAEERQEVTAPPTLPARQPSPPRSPVAKARARTSDAAVSVPTASLRTGDEAIPPPAWISPTNSGGRRLDGATARGTGRRAFHAGGPRSPAASHSRGRADRGPAALAAGDRGDDGRLDGCSRHESGKWAVECRGGPASDRPAAAEEPGDRRQGRELARGRGAGGPRYREARNRRVPGRGRQGAVVPRVDSRGQLSRLQEPSAPATLGSREAGGPAMAPASPECLTAAA